MKKKILFKVDDEVIIESFEDMSIGDILDTISVLCLECSVTNDRITVDFEEYEFEMSLLEINCFGLCNSSGELINGLSLININLDTILDYLANGDYRVVNFIIE